MDRVSPEILDIISSHLEAPLASYATISRAWQLCIERRTFTSLRLRSNEDALQRFDQCLASPRRRTYVKSLDFVVEIPNVSLKRMKKMQSTAEAASNNAVFTRAVHSLFTILSPWTDKLVTDPPKIALTIGAESFQDTEVPEELEYEHYGDPIWESRNSLKYLGFDAALIQTLAGIPSVKAIKEITGFPGRLVDPGSVEVLAAATPAIEKLNLFFMSPPRRLPELRARIRSGLVQYLSSLTSSHLTSIDITFEDSDPTNHSIEPNGLVDHPREDPLGSALQRLGQLPTLQTLTLRGCYTISSNAFSVKANDNVSHEGRSQDTTSSFSHWPSLRSLSLEASIIDTYGSWYFNGDPSAHSPYDDIYESLSDRTCDFDSVDSDQSDFLPQHRWDIESGMKGGLWFRDTPDEKHLGPLIEGVVKFVNGLPIVRTAKLRLGHDPGLELEYSAPGEVDPRNIFNNEERLFHDSKASHARWTLFFMGRDFSKSWEPSSDFMAGFGDFLEGGYVSASNIHGQILFENRLLKN